MRTSCSAAGPSVDLATELTRVAIDPSQTRHLHDILGGYCHECRNYLNSLKISLYLSRRNAPVGEEGAWRGIEASYARLERFVERLQAICRPMPLSLVKLPWSMLVDDRKPAWSRELATAGRQLRVAPPDEAAVGSFDPVRLSTALDGLVTWRARVGDPATDLRVAWGVRDGAFHVVWDEPLREGGAGGPFPAGASEPEELDPLTLPFLARVVASHGGTIDSPNTDRWRLDIRWPLDAVIPQGVAPRC